MMQKIRSLKKYSSHAVTIFFFVGFFIDMFILPDIDHPLTRYVGFSYLGIIAFLIIVREFIVSLNRASKGEQQAYSLSTLGISFFSGSALSFVCIYAIRSAALSVSWPLFLILFICVMANEFVSTHTYRFTLDVGILLLATLFYSIFNVPVLMKVQNDTTFTISVMIAIVVSLAYVFILSRMSESANDESPRLYALAIGIPMFIGMLYFLNVLPAVPLSLKKDGIYHDVFRNDRGEFIARKEESVSFLKRFNKPIYHIGEQDNGVYFFSAVDAPKELSAPISHVWEYYDENTKRWISSAVISFTLEGGRDSGYRAYSYKENVTEGLWRVTVKVDEKRIVGRLQFWVKKGGASVPTETVTL